MFFRNSLDHADVFWKVNLFNGNIISQGPHTYEKIPRDEIESFELLHKGKQIFKINTSKRTLIHRLRTTSNTKLSTLENEIIQRVRVTALLKKNINPEKNIKYKIEENYKIIQEYEFDPEESVIYYHYENGKSDIRYKFGMMFPYRPIKLRPEEMNQLIGTNTI